MKFKRACEQFDYDIRQGIERGEFPYWFKSTKKLKRIVSSCDKQCAYGCPHAQAYYSRETGSFSGALCKIQPILYRRQPDWRDDA